MVKFSSGLLDCIAPCLSKLTDCSLPDMANYDSQSDHWVSNYLLSTIFCGRYPDPHHQIAMAYMRRVEAVFYEYTSARESLVDYLSGPKEAVSKYFASVYHFEQFVAQTYQAYMLMRHLLDKPILYKNEPILYKKGGGSELDRLDIIYNYIKHSDGKLTNRNFPDNATIPVWLTNEGITCKDAELKYKEIGNYSVDADCVIE